ncbi:Cys-rich peptide radical SAM maturase CcpM [Clostridium butyricum]|nr:Cys-rich peptide radical SAM maturase CcpM [Clostridium butyricum]
MNNKPLIKLFKTSKNCYLYDANKNAIINISNNQYEFLENCMKNNVDDYIKSEKTKKLCKEGFLSSNRVKEVIHPDDELLAFQLDNNIKMLTLQITQQCNFRCEYCVYSGNYLNRTHSNSKMSISTAFKGIDFIIKHSKNNNEICIGFYGGEPLLEFNFVKQCIEYAEKKAEGKSLSFTMTTNGSLLSDEIIEFLYKHNVFLTISLDGPQEIQDNHRKLTLNNSGSFNKVFNNIINLKDNFPDYTKSISFNAVIDTQSDFYCIDKFFLDNEIVKDITVTSTLISNNYKKSDINVDEDYYLKHEYELFRIFYYLIRGNNIKNCSKIAVNTYNELLNFSKKLKPQKMLPEKGHHSGPCTPGTARLFMSADGFFYPCERVSESSDLMKIGHVDTGFDINKVRKILNLGQVDSESCKNCWSIRLCTICAAILDTSENEFSLKRKKECCKQCKENVEEMLKNYCFLKEFGHNFDEHYEPIPINYDLITN